MRITVLQGIVAMIFSGMAVAHSNHAQEILNREVSIKVNEVTLNKALSEISAAANVRFVYSPSGLKFDEKVSVDFSKRKLGEVLEALLAPRSIKYTVEEGEEYIILTEKSRPSPEQTGSINSPPSFRTVTGQVTDTLGAGMAGVNVMIKGTANGTTTDNGGFFSIEAKEEEVLVFSFIGFKTVEITVSDQSMIIRISLREDVESLKEVVINSGFQTLKVNEVTGSVVSISKEQLNQRVAPTVLEKLEGITNGLVFNKDPRTGQNKLRIRGESTIFGYSNPLVVVDNFPYPYERINEINPNDVESVTVLKDAAAASIWGVQAGNGVIVITTKKGRRNQPLTVGITANTTITEKPDLYYQNLIGSSDYVDFENYLFQNGRYDSELADPNYTAVSPVVEILNKYNQGDISETEANAQLDVLRKADWRKEFLDHMYQRAVTQQYQVNMSGGTNRTGYYISAGYDKERSTRIGNENSRLTLNSNSSIRPVDNLELQIGLSYVQTNVAPNTADVLNLYPYTRLADAEGNPLAVPMHRVDFEDTITNAGFLDWKYYPLLERNFRDNTDKTNSFRVLTGLKYTLFKGLTFDATYQYYYSTQNSRSLTKAGSYFIRNNINTFAIITDGRFTGSNYPAGGTLGYYNVDQVSHNGRAKFEYNNTWGDHTVSALAGFDVSERVQETDSHQLLGYDERTGTFATPNPYTYYPTYPTGALRNFGGDDAYRFTATGTIQRFRSYFFNAAYTFKSRYMISGSMRFDGSNYFGVKTNNKTVPLWSVGAKWDINKEAFYSSKLFPALSLRATYGYNGNMSPSVVAITTFEYNGNANYTGLPYAIINNTPNPQLRWEKSGQFNVGLDFSMKEDIVSGSVEYFRKNGKDLIGDAPQDPTTGVNILRGNFANMETNGVDIRVSSKNVDRQFKWTTTGIFNYARDIVTNYDSPGSADSYLGAFYGTTPIKGYPMASMFSFQWGGLDPANGNPRIILGDTLNSSYDLGDNLKKSDLVYNGRYNPPCVASLINTFSWKGLSLTVALTGKFGHYFRRSSVSFSQLALNKLGWNLPGSGDYDQRWQQPGDERITNVPSFSYPADAANPQRDEYYTNSTALIEKADHIRVQFIQLNYSLNETIARKLHFRSMNFYFYANNLGIIWRANNKGIDPDYPYQSYPLAKTYSLGISASF